MLASQNLFSRVLPAALESSFVLFKMDIKVKMIHAESSHSRYDSHSNQGANMKLFQQTFMILWYFQFFGFSKGNIGIFPKFSNHHRSNPHISKSIYPISLKLYSYLTNRCILKVRKFFYQNIHRKKVTGNLLLGGRNPPPP